MARQCIRVWTSRQSECQSHLGVEEGHGFAKLRVEVRLGKGRGQDTEQLRMSRGLGSCGLRVSWSAAAWSRRGMNKRCRVCMEDGENLGGADTVNALCSWSMPQV